MVPSISGESGKEGWTAIKDEAANASAGTQINVDMNGASVVPGDVLDSMKGQDHHFLQHGRRNHLDCERSGCDGRPCK